ncbi:hypothetical protein VNO78_26392 [Psophocarpus tetragonolobus]|uniref:Uncharacterized protein n=1 Tax=Psophocarpus tetragonolobus TaxID=3891 RepID=A0AAN9RZD3_PSOTE
MAMRDANHQNLSKLQIEAVMSVSPSKETLPRQVRQVLMSHTDSLVNPNAIHGSYQIVLYYENLNEEDPDMFLAGWIVESICSALFKHPLLAGRLIDNKGLLEIVSNDSGIRLYEARFPMILSEFLALSEKEHLEAELVFWKEIDEHNPQFSPLFYVQVTQFECGGYSIGISCSLLLADVLVAENFLKTWTEIHKNMFLQNEEIKAPIYYHPLLKKKFESPSGDVISRTPTNKARNIVFKVTAKDFSFNKELWRDLAMLCVAEAEHKLHKKMWTNFNLFVKESSDVIKVEGYAKNGKYKEVLDQSLNNQISGATWIDFGDHVTFHEGNKPVLVSRWIGSTADGKVIVVPCPEEDASAVIVSFPFEKELENGF